MTVGINSLVSAAGAASVLTARPRMVEMTAVVNFILNSLKLKLEV